MLLNPIELPPLPLFGGLHHIVQLNLIVSCLPNPALCGCGVELIRASKRLRFECSDNMLHLAALIVLIHPCLFPHDRHSLHILLIQVLRGEIEIMRSLRHENIVQMLDTFETEDQMVAVTEFADGELFQVWSRGFIL